MLQRKNWVTPLLWSAPLGFLALFYFFPLANILGLSLSKSQDGWAQPFLTLFSSQGFRQVLWFTIWQAALSTFLTLIVGLPGAYLLARFKFWGKSILRALTGIPFVLPTLVVAAALNALLGPRGWLNQALMTIFNLESPPIHFVNTISAILLAHVFYNTTIILRMVGDFWSHIDPGLQQAARVLGANRWQSLRHITLPLLLPVIYAAALLIFIFDFTSFGVILILGGPRYATLEVEIYYQTISLFNLPMAAALSSLQLLFTFLLTLVYTRLAARVSRPITIRPIQVTQKPLHTWKSKLFAILIITFLLTLLVSPLLALATRSIFTLNPLRSLDSNLGSPLTLAYYRELFINQRESLFYVPPTSAIAISLGYASITVALAIALGLPAAWALSRDIRSKLNLALDPILMLPLGTSAVTLGLGFIVALANPPLNLRTSPLLIPLAHTLVAYPFVVRSLTPALRSIRPRLRQAASVLGASPSDVFRHIDIPLIGRSLLVAASFAFSISMGEFGATVLLARPEFPTIPLVIYRLISHPGAMNYGQAMALSTILMLVTGAGILLIERFRLGKVGEF